MTNNQTPEERQFIYNKEKGRVECRCGHPAVKLRDGYLCGTITAYPCEYNRSTPVVQQSLTTESVVKKSLTSEESLNRGNYPHLKTPEERSRDILIQHNKWRRADDDVQMVDSKELGLAFDTAISALGEVKQLREALKGLLYLSQDLIDDLDAWDKDYPEIEKAKQLLNEE